MKNLTLLLIFTLAIACQPNQEKTNTVAAVAVYERPDHHSELITKVFDAHGGYEQWSKMKTLSYTKGDEATITDLQSRKIRLETPKQTIGFDGENVWVTPDFVDASRARFYHNLYFYFYAMPFVVGDPGAFYEDVEPKEIKGKMYNGIKISYGENVGDAPDDNYILWYDLETGKMGWLMYTVTYRSGEPSDKFNLIKYDQWSEFNGIVLPTAIQWYHYKDGVVGAMRNEVIFSDIQITDQAPNSSLFEMPEGAQIAPFPSK
jgi:hypothetical protein